jgi:hypothetical protein
LIEGGAVDLVGAVFAERCGGSFLRPKAAIRELAKDDRSFT